MLLGFLWNSLLIMKWESSFADHISFVWICQTDMVVCRCSRFQGNILKSHSSGQAIKTLPFSFLNLIYSQQSPGDRVQNKSSPRRVEVRNNSPFFTKSFHMRICQAVFLRGEFSFIWLVLLKLSTWEDAEIGGPVYDCILKTEGLSVHLIS